MADPNQRLAQLADHDNNPNTPWALRVSGGLLIWPALAVLVPVFFAAYFGW